MSKPGFGSTYVFDSFENGLPATCTLASLVAIIECLTFRHKGATAQIR